MIAYNKTWLRNIAVVKKVNEWSEHGLLSKEQYSAAMTQYPIKFYNPNIFIKIGLFIFTWLAIGTTLGFYALIIADSLDSSGIVPLTSILFAIGSFALLELFIKQNHIYQSGTDEALLYSGLISIAVTIADIFNYNLDNQGNALLFSILISVFLLVAVLRYADKLVALILSLLGYTIYFLLILKIGSIAKLIMPFAFMGLSILVYFKAKQIKHLDKLFYWSECITVLEWVSLLVFYASGNYFVIREASVAYFGINLKTGQDMPLAFVFYLFTAIVPLLYIFFGLKKKDKILLWIGLILVAASVLTFKHYFSLGHPEVTLTISGILMIIISYASIRYFKSPRQGITFEESLGEDNFLKTNAEALLLAQSFSHTPSADAPLAHQREGFGGGESGGAGAGGSF